jgi:uncharacterized protein (TIGR00369 family)
MNMVKEWIEELSHLFNEKAPIARFFGMKLEYDDNGSAVVDLPYNSSLDHAVGGVHGGVYATLLDCAGWFTVAAAHEPYSWFVTSELTIRYLEPVSGKSLRAVGRVIKQGRRQDVAEMQLFDEDGQLVGHATGTFMLINNVKMPKSLVVDKD